ncbi:LemA family protein [Hydrogenimonas urashimensis]|uniref:LemA family protein n=1 Tax=Hydrogenimonas urashimensis TaxID=2740515 RepID=UPI00191521EE|nr:LemA family protein [Hydrogenimonas urashimensis]
MKILVAIGIILLLAVLIYNTLVSRRNQCDNIFASIDALLKKRYNLIPNLVTLMKESMRYERDLLERVTQLRAKAMRPNLTPEEKIAIADELTQPLHGLMVAVENYPELKANEQIMQLMRSLNEIEEQIAAARRAYNQAVTDYNNARQMFPSSLIAAWFRFQPKELFEIPETERKNIDIKELLKS